MISLIIFTLLIVFLLSIYILVRNNFVYKFVTNLNETCYQICLDHNNKIYDCNNLEDFMKEHEKLEDMWESISKIKYCLNNSMQKPRILTLSGVFDQN